MTKSADKINRHLLDLLFYTGIVIVLSLTLLNITNYLEGKSVLGVSTINASPEADTREKDFWTSFVNKNPNYIDGWIELGRLDKVKEIDPNYIKP